MDSILFQGSPRFLEATKSSLDIFFSGSQAQRKPGYWHPVGSLGSHGVRKWIRRITVLWLELKG